MKYVLLICTAILLLGFLQTIFGLNLFTAFQILFENAVKFSRRYMGSHYIVDEDYVNLLSTREKEKNKLYKLDVFIKELILDLGLNVIDITSSGFLNFILFLSLGVDVLVWFFSKNLLVFILSVPVSYISIICLIYTFTRNSHYNRIVRLMEIENMLCVTMSKGIVNSVNLNIDKIPETYRGTFQIFLQEQRAKSTEYALKMLNYRLGAQFNDFCNKALILDTVSPQGYASVFSFNIKKNSRQVKLIAIKKAKASGKVLDAIVSSFLLIGALILFDSLYTFMHSFFATGLGKIYILVYIGCIVGLFIRIQLLINKEV